VEFCYFSTNGSGALNYSDLFSLTLLVKDSFICGDRKLSICFSQLIQK
jgi:hypothetical protein